MIRQIRPKRSGEIHKRIRERYRVGPTTEGSHLGGGVIRIDRAPSLWPVADRQSSKLLIYDM